MEKDGKITSDVPTKYVEDKNQFTICLAPSDKFDKSVEELNQFCFADMIAEIKAKILERSQTGIADLQKIFEAMDERGDGQLDCDDFRWGLIDFGISLTKMEAMTVLENFDKDKNGTVSFSEFLQTL